MAHLVEAEEARVAMQVRWRAASYDLHAGAALAAQRPVMKPYLRDAIFRAAIHAADHHLIVFHNATFTITGVRTRVCFASTSYGHSITVKRLQVNLRKGKGP